MKSGARSVERRLTGDERPPRNCDYVVTDVTLAAYTRANEALVEDIMLSLRWRGAARFPSRRSSLSTTRVSCAARAPTSSPAAADRANRSLSWR